MSDRQPSEREMPLSDNVDHTGHAHVDHVVSPAVYLAVFLALLVGTAVTVLVAQKDLGRLNTPVALGIAITKATLVILFFMHVKYSPRLTKLVLAAAFGWLLLMILGVLSDFVFMGWLGDSLTGLLGRKG